MYKVLIVEDNANDLKNRKILKILAKLENITYEVRGTIKCAEKYLSENIVDILITDIQIPKSYDSESIDKHGGRHLIERIFRRSEKLIIPKLIVGVTSHNDSLDGCQKFFDDNSFPLLHTEDINNRLTKAIQNHLIQNSRDKLETYDTVIITALRHTEFEAIEDLNLNWNTSIFNLGTITYRTGYFEDSRGFHRKVLACSCTNMGSVSSASTTSMLIERFHPKVVIMTGIAAGIESKVNLGDIVVAESTWEYEAGKRTIENGIPVFHPNGHRINLDRKIRTVMSELTFNKGVVNDIYSKCTVKGKPNNAPTVVVGPMVSGASVLEDPEIVKYIKDQQDRKVVAIEMEAYGVSFACENAISQPTCIIIKSICDFANLDKNDDFQRYAAYTSAELCYHYLCKIHNFN